MPSLTGRIPASCSPRCGHAAEAVLGRSGDDALRALMRAYRSYVVAHPERYTTLGHQLLPIADSPEIRVVGSAPDEAALGRDDELVG